MMTTRAATRARQTALSRNMLPFMSLRTSKVSTRLSSPICLLADYRFTRTFPLRRRFWPRFLAEAKLYRWSVRGS